MTQTSQAQACSNSIQQCWSESIAMAFAGIKVIQAQKQNVMESALESATATAKANIEAMSAQMAEAAHGAQALLREQGALFNDFPTDPMGVSQRMVAAYVDASQKSLDFGTKALTSWAGLLGEAWVRAGKLSQETAQAYVECASKLQELAAARPAQ
jgi:hypothetical protein